MDGGTRSPSALQRWSCQDKQLPDVGRVRELHVYDFDNTLFRSPLPNKQIWNGATLGQLGGLDTISTGGWWHDVNILASTGKGVEEEEKTGWEGWWNENIVELVRLSMEQRDVLTVLLTGRRESGFAELLGKMVKSKGLEFDMLCLKPAVSPANTKIGSTMMFKQELLRDMVFTYTDADEIRVYEDRPKHTKAFRDFFGALNRNLQKSNSQATRPPIMAEVIQVPENGTTLDPITEVSEVQRMVNTHNQAVLSGGVALKPLAIKRTVFYTGYLISPTDTARLKTLVMMPPNTPEHEVRILANQINICPRPAQMSIMDKVGGIGHRVRWRVTHLACLEGRVWAARVTPTDASTSIYTETPVPMVVLALKRNAKPFDANRIQQWTPVEREVQLEFETIVGEKVLLRIEAETQDESAFESTMPSYAKKRARDDAFPALGHNADFDGSIPSHESQQHPQGGQVNAHAMQFGAGSGPSRAQGRNTHNQQHDHRPHGGGVNKGAQRGGNGGRGGGRGFRGGRGGGGGRGGRGGKVLEDAEDELPSGDDADDADDAENELPSGDDVDDADDDADV